MLVELVFEEVNRENVSGLLSDIVSMADKIAAVQCTAETTPALDIHLDQRALSSVLHFAGNVSVAVSLHNLRLGDELFPTVLLRLTKYDQNYDLDFSFDTDELECTEICNLIGNLHRAASLFASKHHVQSFFAGIEPASDKHTRFFTCSQPGPLILD